MRRGYVAGEKAYLMLICRDYGSTCDGLRATNRQTGLYLHCCTQMCPNARIYVMADIVSFYSPSSLGGERIEFWMFRGQSVRILSTIYSARSVHDNTIRFYYGVDFHLFTSRPAEKQSGGY